MANVLLKSSPSGSSSHGDKPQKSPGSSHGTSLPRVKRNNAYAAREGNNIAGHDSNHSDKRRIPSNGEAAVGKLNGSVKRATHAHSKSFDGGSIPFKRGNEPNLEKQSSDPKLNGQKFEKNAPKSLHMSLPDVGLVSSSHSIRKGRKPIKTSDADGESSEDPRIPSKPLNETVATSSQHSRAKPYFPKQEPRALKKSSHSTGQQSSPTSDRKKNPPMRKLSNTSGPSSEQEPHTPTRQIRPDNLDGPEPPFSVQSHKDPGPTSLLDSSIRSNLRFSAHKESTSATPAPLLGSTSKLNHSLASSTGKYLMNPNASARSNSDFLKTPERTNDSEHNHKSLCGLLPKAKSAMDGESSVSGGTAMVPDLMYSSFSSLQSTETMSTILASKKKGLIVECDFSEGPMKDFLGNLTSAIERKQKVGPVSAASFSDSAHTNSSNGSSIVEMFKRAERIEDEKAKEDAHGNQNRPGQKPRPLQKTSGVSDHAGSAYTNNSLNGSLAIKSSLSSKMTVSALGPPIEPSTDDCNASLPSLMSYGGHNDDGSMPSLASYRTNGTKGSETFPSYEEEDTSDDVDDDAGDNNTSMPSLCTMKDEMSVMSRPTPNSSDGDNDTSLPSLSTIKDEASTIPSGQSSISEYNEDESNTSNVEGDESVADEAPSDIDESAPSLEKDEIGIDDSYEESGSEYEESMTELDDQRMNDSYYDGLLAQGDGVGEESEGEEDLLLDVDGEEALEDKQHAPIEREVSEEDIKEAEDGSEHRGGSISGSQSSYTSYGSRTGSQSGSLTGSLGEGFRKPVVSPNLPTLGVNAPSHCRLSGKVKFGGNPGDEKPGKQFRQKQQEQAPKQTVRTKERRTQKEIEPKAATGIPKMPKRRSSHEQSTSEEKSKRHGSREKPKKQNSQEKPKSRKSNEKVKTSQNDQQPVPKQPQHQQHDCPAANSGAAAHFVVQPTKKKKKKKRDDKEEKVRQWKEQFQQEELLQQQKQQEELLKQQLLIQQQMLLAANNQNGGDGQGMMSQHRKGAGPMGMPRSMSGASSHSDHGIPELNSVEHNRPGGRRGNKSNLRKSKSIDNEYDFSFMDHPDVPELEEVDADAILKPMNPSQIDEDGASTKEQDPKSQKKDKDKKSPKPSLASRFKKSVTNIKNNFGSSKSKGLSQVDTGLNERQFFPDLDDDDDEEYTMRSLLSSSR